MISAWWKALLNMDLESYLLMTFVVVLLTIAFWPIVLDSKLLGR